MEDNRGAGVLLHPTSFPGSNGIGELGEEALLILDWIHDAGLSLWQILPLGPTGYGDSPYACFSAFAGNPLLISLDSLVQDGWLTGDDLDALKKLPHECVDYGAVITGKNRLLDKAYHNWQMKVSSDAKEEFYSFCQNQSSWLTDFALFMALKKFNDGKVWSQWIPEHRDHNPDSMNTVRRELREKVEREQWLQYTFFQQWEKIRSYANGLNIQIIGDMPIFVAYDSADVWANRHLFNLDEKGNSTVVAGVPPDYFSKTGQLWGNPLYNWKAHEQEGFYWWKDRIRSTLKLVDQVRIDHFRGFDSYWEIPAEEETAVNGKWIDNEYGAKLFETLHLEMGDLPLIAEDLGDLSYGHTQELRKKFDLPGMKILQFAFGGDATNPYLPHNIETDCVIYTGTHDNNTTAGWWKETTDSKIRKHLTDYIGHKVSDPNEELLRIAYSSTAVFAITPMQDLLGLGSEGMMNQPGKAYGNWSWRLDQNLLTEELAEQMKNLAVLYGRMPGVDKQG